MPQDHPNPEELKPVEGEPVPAPNMPLDDIFSNKPAPQESAEDPTIWQDPNTPEQVSEPSPPLASEPAPAATPTAKPAEAAGVAPVQEPVAPQPVSLTPEAIAAAFMQMRRAEEQAKQPPQEIPDPEYDPAGAWQYHQKQLKDLDYQRRAGQSDYFARRFNPDFVDVVGNQFERWKEYLGKNPDMADAMVSAMEQHEAPVQFIYDVLKKDQTLAKYGNDPEAYINEQVEKRIAERQQQPAPAGQPNLQVVPQQAQKPQATIPEPMGNQPSAAPRGQPKFEGEMPLDEILRRPATG